MMTSMYPYLRQICPHRDASAMRGMHTYIVDQHLGINLWCSNKLGFDGKVMQQSRDDRICMLAGLHQGEQRLVYEQE